MQSWIVKSPAIAAEVGNYLPGLMGPLDLVASEQLDQCEHISCKFFLQTFLMIKPICKLLFLNKSKDVQHKSTVIAGCSDCTVLIIGSSFVINLYFRYLAKLKMAATAYVCDNEIMYVITRLCM